MQTLPRMNVFTLDRYRLTSVSREDAPLNAEWDRLVRLVEEAWTWRDPETIAALCACVARLGQRSLAEWREIDDRAGDRPPARSDASRE
jgi:hypothetical protein